MTSEVSSSSGIFSIKNLTLTIVICTLLIILASIFLEDFYLDNLSRAFAFGIAATSVWFIVKFGGMISFGHSAFFGIGAYCVLVAFQNNIGEALIVWPIAATVAGIAAMAIGSISLLTSGVSFIMITLAFAQMVFYLISSIQSFGASDGQGIYIRNTIAGQSIESSQAFFWTVSVILLCAILFFHSLGRSSFGKTLSGIRQNEQRIQALGFNTYQLKLIAFVLSGSVCGLAGAVTANYFLFVSPSLLNWIVSGDFLVMITLGGLSSVFGGAIGALFLLLSETLLSEYTTYWRVILGPIIIIAILKTPNGLLGFFRKNKGGYNE